MSKYKATQWESADQKDKFERQFMLFVGTDFDRKNFPKWFYQRLSQTFGHIAHYDQSGFWEEWFTNAHDQVRFLEHTLARVPVGDPEYTYSDVEKDIQCWLREGDFLKKARLQWQDEIDQKDRSEFRRLSDKFASDASRD